MPTLKQIAKSPHWWGKLQAGATVRVGHYGDFEEHTVTETDAVRRMFKTYTQYDYDTPYPYVLLEEETTLYFLWPLPNGKYENARAKPEDVELIKMPSVPKSFRTAATKGSTWRFKEDWTFAGYNNSFTEYTIPAGTEFTIADNKMPMVYFSRGYWQGQNPCIGFDEKAIRIVKPIPNMSEMFHSEEYLPLREVSAYVELVSEGQRKVYWLIENGDGERMVDKRFKNLGNVKSSLRVRGGLVRQDDDAANYNYSNQPDYWYEQDNEWDTAAFPTQKGVWAVQYDHGTDEEISREDMLQYMTMAKLMS